MDKELTVVIPSYNMERFLPKCLESFGLDLLQKEDGALADALEVIVVNDGSADRTSEVAHRFEGSFPTVVKVIDKANGNYGSCVNVALRGATGRYIRILDADDYFETGECAKYLRFLISLHGAADLVVNDYDEVGASGKATSVVRYGLPSDAVFPFTASPIEGRCWSEWATGNRRGSCTPTPSGIRCRCRRWRPSPIVRAC